MPSRPPAQASCPCGLSCRMLSSLPWSIFLPSRSGEEYITPVVAARRDLIAIPPRLFRDQQALREWPVVIHPLRLAPKSSPLSHFHHFLAAILVRALCPNGFSRTESDLHARARNPHLL